MDFSQNIISESEIKVSRDVEFMSLNLNPDNCLQMQYPSGKSLC